MEMEIWHDQAMELVKIVSAISKHFGGDESAFLKSYIDDLIREYRLEMQEPIKAYRDIARILGLQIN